MMPSRFGGERVRQSIRLLIHFFHLRGPIEEMDKAELPFQQQGPPFITSSFDPVYTSSPAFYSGGSDPDK